MNQVIPNPWPKLGNLVVVIFIFLSLGCQRKATAATVRELERRLILLELKLRETEGRLLVRMDELAQVPPTGGTAEPRQPEKQPMVAAENPKPSQKVMAPDPVSQPIEASAFPSKLVEPSSLGPVPQESKAPSDSHLPLIAAHEVKTTYQSALVALESRQFNRAERLLSAMLAQHPNHSLAPNSAYWLGEVYYSRYQFQRAIVVFGRVIEDYPKSHKVADALLKQGRCHERLGQLDQARTAYQRVIEQFPRSTAATLARKWL